ncbi:MAG: diguanylate cyclase [Desulfobacterales bacterium]|nr:diguanylate cyclase [Desulfobacterales bacterium]
MQPAIIEANPELSSTPPRSTPTISPSLYNKRKLDEQMGRLFKQFKTGQKKLFVAMIDIDQFKTLNDTLRPSPRG